MTPVCASANVLPIVGCPAIGISCIGVKMRIRMSVSGRLGGQDERALGKIHLARQSLHLCRVQSARISEYRQLVAEQRFACEHIVVKV